MKTALFFACDKRLLFALGTALLSLKQNSPKVAAESAIIIYSQGFTEEDKSLLNAILPCTIVEYSCPIETRNFSPLVFARYEIFDLLNSFDKVLYIDADVLIRGELGFIFKYFGNSDGIALCKDNQKRLDHIDKDFIKPPAGYDMAVPCYNAGVMLVSRELKNREKLKSWCYERSGSWMDNLTRRAQGVINVMLQEFAIEAEELPDICNCLPSTARQYLNRFDKRVLIYHSTGGALSFWRYTHHSGWLKFYREYLAMGGKPHGAKESLWLRFINHFGLGRFNFFDYSPNPQIHLVMFLEYLAHHFMKKMLLSMFANKPAIKDYDFSKIKSVLINPIGYALGDTAVNTAMCNQLKAAFPDITIGILNKPYTAPLLEKNPCVDITFKRSLKNALLQRKKWEVYLDMSTNWTTNNILLTFFLKPKYNITFEKIPTLFLSEVTVKNYDYYARYGDTHTSLLLKKTPLSEFLDFSEIVYTLPDVSDLMPTIEAWWKKGNLRILFNPCGNNYRRKINREDALKILEEIYSRHTNIEVLIINTPDNRGLLGDFKKYKFTPPTLVLEMVALCKSADIVLTVDTALIHIACALKKRLVAVYGNSPLNYKRFKPLDNGLSDAVISKKPMQFSEIEELNADEVIDAVSKHILAVREA